MTLEYSIDQIEEVAGRVLAFAKAEILLFNAPMGAGKTTLIKQMCRNLGVAGEVNSPTFSIVNEYITDRINVYHFDLYRLDSAVELYDIGFEDYLDKPGLKFIEWPELASEFIDRSTTVHIEILDPTTRILKISNN
ncbi:MAG: tRNA (adenosine(37)-N6)-threonylcarbamoyltransferase complex ATPase subunit type 1 TsaE [Nonlabens sp.]